MENIIDKNTSIEKAREILSDIHGVPLSPGWDLVLGSMLQECDYIIVNGYGTKAILTKVYKEE